LIEYLDKTGAILGIVLILFVLIYLLVLFILMARFLEQTRKMVERNFILRWEEMIFEYLSTDKSPQDTIVLFTRYSYKYLLQFLRSYLLTLKGSDKEKLMRLINETVLYDYLIKHLKSIRKKRIVFGAYFLGLAKSIAAAYELKNRLKFDGELVFVTRAMSLARINALDALDEIFKQAKKFKDLTKDTILYIILEYDDLVCDNLTKRLDEEDSIVNKSIIVTALSNFKYLSAAPKIVEMLAKESDKGMIIDMLRYLGEVEFIDASEKLEAYLQVPDPDIKTEAIKTVSKIGDTRLEDKIWELIQDKNRTVKVTAADALYEISDKSRERLKDLENTMPNSLESSIAKMIIEQRAIQAG
jgi:hypothetical protein